MEHIEWFNRITAGDSHREVSRRSGVPNRTIANQVSSGTLKPEVIIKVAEGYNESPVIALVDLGFISARWITEPGVVTSLSRATDEQLTDELLRRLKLIDDEPVDELAAKRSNKGAGHVGHGSYDGTVKEFDWSQPHAADSSPHEQEEREKRGEEPID